ncbi:MAG: AI-2E family transporter [Planctomycetia bacterium]|nr:AI-2E family transporter [Planctomycetia bacterium]
MLFFSLLGLKFAFLFALMTFMLNFIPSLGTIISTLLPIPILMVTMEDITNTQLMLALLLPCLVENFFGNFLEPKLQSEELKLHPVTVLLALGYWELLWGPVGMLLATPTTATIRIILLEFKMTQPIAELMSEKME